MNAYHREILERALLDRKKEIIEYQVNIDNYARAAVKCGDDPDLQDFKAGLKETLAASLVEQKKAQIIHDVIAEQLEEANVG